MPWCDPLLFPTSVMLSCLILSSLFWRSRTVVVHVTDLEHDSRVLSYSILYVYPRQTFVPSFMVGGGFGGFAQLGCCLSRSTLIYTHPISNLKNSYMISTSR